MTLSAKAALLARAAIVVAGLGWSASAAAQTVSGRVLDAEKKIALPGAQVQVDGTNIVVSTDRDGGFTIDHVPAGPLTLTVNYTGYSAQTVETAADAAPLEIALSDQTALSDIVVTGTLLSERRAIQTKKASNAITETLFANDVGKLPDQNVAEAVRRLPGLSVANDQGEGRYVIIRGINPNLVNVVLNGQTLPAPEPDGRQVKLDDIPSAVIGSVVVSKSLSADQDANAIGGEINIRTATAFDRNKRFFADARAAYGTFAINGRHPFEGDVQIGGFVDKAKTLGIVLSGNYSQRPITSENFQGSTNWRAPVPANGFIVPDNYGLRDYNLVRERIGYVGNVDWRPNESFKLFLKTSYSYYSDDETRDQNLIENQSNFRNQTATTGTFSGRGSIRVRRRVERDNTASINLGGSFLFGQSQLDLSGAWTRAQKRDPLRSEYNIRTGGSALTVNYDVSDTPYIFTQTNTVAQTAYSLNSVNYDVRNAVETIWQGRADLSLPVNFGDDTVIKVGAKYLARSKFNARDILTFGLAAGRTLTLANVSSLGDTDFFNGRYVFGPRINYDTAQAFLAANPGTIAVNIAGSRSNSLANDYDVNENIASGYVLATVKVGQLTLIPGVRVENTSDTLRAKLFDTTSPLDLGFNSSTRVNYTDVFPGLNARLDLTQRAVIRAAVTTSIGRPNYPDLAPYVSIDTTTTPRPTVVLGNPNLKPYRAYNLDLVGEYYLPGQGLLSLGVFYKNLSNPIYTGTNVNTSGTFAGTTFAAVDVTQALNIQKAFVLGFEANAQVRFTFLPAPFDGFGVSANYSHITGHANGFIPFAVPRNDRVPLFLQSRDVANGQIFYEKYGFAVRVAYSFRSPYLDTLGTTAALDQYTDKNGQLDLNASYEAARQLSFFFSATNLTDAPNRRYIGIKRQLIEFERYDFAVRWGVQLHF